MVGTILNVAGILVGSVAGLAGRKPLAPVTQAYFKIAIGAFTVFYGLRLTWISVNGPFLNILKQLLVVLVALMLGKLTGRLLHLQTLSNALGRSARERMASAANARARAPDDGFKVCAVLFCAAPLGILGSIQDGLSEYFYPLAVKAVIEGLGIITGFILCIGRIVGETACLYITMGGSSAMPTSLLSGGRTLSLHLFYLAMETNAFEKAMATGAVLIIIVLIINTITNWISYRFQARMRGGA